MDADGGSVERRAMMAQCDPAISDVLKWEGGLCNDNDDPGGCTAFGFSQRDNPDIDVTKLTRAEAIERYAKRWQLSGLQDQALANKVFNLQVNCGMVTGIMLLQQAINKCSSVRVHLDGVLGPQTVLAANACDPVTLLGTLKMVAVQHYDSLIAHNPKLAKFRNGWVRRAMA